ncbi:WD repeat-containing protein 18 isoform X1 [Lampetra planeri]
MAGTVVPAEVLVCAGADESAPGGGGCGAWDARSGASLASYRGGGAAARTLCLAGGRHLLGAQRGKSYVNAWDAGRKQEQLQQKLVCPGPVSCLAASPDGLHLVAGIAQTLYLWEMGGGSLLAVLSRHYQDVSCVCFSDDGSHFVSGGRDNLALVWNVGSVVQAGSAEPRHVWSQHTLPITDLQCGAGGPLARIATASLDQTVKLWELASGRLLLSVLLSVGLTALALDPAEYHVFCGGVDGAIYRISLYNTNHERTLRVNEDDEEAVFRGHTGEVRCLCVTMDGSLLVSGSQDHKVCVWDVASRQCLRTITMKANAHSPLVRRRFPLLSPLSVFTLSLPSPSLPSAGPVTNALLVPPLPGLVDSEPRPALTLPRLARHLAGASDDGAGESGAVTVRSARSRHMGAQERTLLQELSELRDAMQHGIETDGLTDPEGRRLLASELQEEVHRLRAANTDLYKFASTQLHPV